jgi:hypothetical protein
LQHTSNRRNIMHGLNQIVRMNREQEEFIAHILSTPTPEVNLLKVWQDWKQEKAHEPVQVHTD